MILNSSDCEDNSSGGEEEFTQVSIEITHNYKNNRTNGIYCYQTIGRRLLSTTVPHNNNLKLQTTLDRVFRDAEKLRSKLNGMVLF